MNIIPLFIAIPLAAAFFIPMVSRRWRSVPDTLGNLVTFSLLVLSLAVIGENGIYAMGGWLPPLGINLVLDGLSILMLIIVSLVAFSSTLFSISYMELYTSKLRYYSLFLLMVAGMNGVILAGDIFNMYVFLEIAAIASYALVGFGCEHEELEASFKYLVLGSVASTFILFAIAIIYGLVGSLNMAQIGKLIGERGMNSALYFSLGLFIAGFGLKAALVPFHAWLPDAHPSAPAPISAMLSGVLIKALGIYTMIRILFNVFGFSSTISSIMIALGLLSMIMGGLLALGQWDYKRLLAWSSISQIGYVMIGVGLGTPLGILGGLFHLINHATFKSLLFFTAGAIEYNTGTRQLKEMGGLREKMPVTGTSAFIASLSISGIPPFNGFWSKLIIVIACIEAGRYGLAISAIVVSIITLAYYMKVQKHAFFDRIKEKWTQLKEVPLSMCIPMVLLSFLCLVMGLLLIPSIRNLVLNPAVDVLTEGTGYTTKVLGR